MLQQISLDSAAEGPFWRDFFQRNKYARDIINIIEWVLNIAAILTSLVVLFPDLLTSSSAHIIAAVAVFCAWFNYLLYLQRYVNWNSATRFYNFHSIFVVSRFNSFGIYIVMFLEILSTLLRVLFVFSVLIIAFGLSFHILIQHIGKDEKGFYSPFISMVRVSTMMLGEIDFLNTFLGPMRSFVDETTVGLRNQMAAAIWFLLIFAILMPILLMNLLIGLAVGDIETVRRNASMKRLAMQIEHHTDLERRLPKQILNCVRKIEIYEYPNKRNNCATTFIVS